MSTVLKIEHAIERLKPTERAQLAAWIARKEAVDWDAQMSADAAAGKLDFLFNFDMSKPLFLSPPSLDA